jgi:hypothetical protein
MTLTNIPSEWMPPFAARQGRVSYPLESRESKSSEVQMVVLFEEPGHMLPYPDLSDACDQDFN